MDRRSYLRETSEALREAEEQRHEARLKLVSANAEAAGTKALDRFTGALRAEGLKQAGEFWQCPSCRSQGREPDFVLQLKIVGKHLEMACSRNCRPNTIRTLLGAPPYFPSLGRAKPVGKFPFR